MELHPYVKSSKIEILDPISSVQHLTILDADKLNLVKFVELYEFDPITINNQNIYGQTPLIISSINKRYDIVNFILSLQNADFNIVDETGFNFLNYLCLDEDIDLDYFIKEFLNKHKMINICLNNFSPVWKQKIYESVIDFPKYYETAMSQDFKNYILNDDVVSFDENFTLAPIDSFILACQYNSIKIIDYCIDKFFGLNFLSLDRNSGFTYLCFHNNYELSIKLIRSKHLTKSFLSTKDSLKKSPIFYANLSVMNPIKMELLSINSSEYLDDFEFKVYEEEDFDFVKYESENEFGSFGSAVHVIDKTTGKDMIIKKYTECEDLTLTDSTMREITYLRWVNKVYPNIATKIYGIYFESRTLHLVQEYLAYTLAEILFLIRGYDLQSKETHIKIILKSLLVSIDIINSMGICHNDLKESNVMIDSEGRLKIIDFGLSEFLGISPNKSFNETVAMTKFISPIDTYPPFYTASGFYVNPSLKTINADVFSVGVLIFNFIYDSPFVRYTVINNKLYFAECPDENPASYDRFIVCSTNEIDRYDPELKDLLFNMIESNSEFRYYASECLKHKYFTGEFYLRPNSVRFLGDKIDNPTRYDYLRECDRELFYKKEQINVIKERKLLEVTKNETKLFPQYMWLLKVITNKKYKFSIDAYINAINNFRKISSIITIDESEYKMYLCVSIMIANLQIDYINNEYSCYREICNNKFTENDFKRAMRRVVSSVDIFDFIPINSLVYIIPLELRKSRITSIKLNRIILKIYTQLVIWTIYNTGPQLSIYDIIRSIYVFESEKDITLMDHDPFDEPYNLEHYPICKSVFKKEDSNCKHEDISMALFQNLLIK